MKCRVTFETQNPELLPVDVVDNFCAQTPHVVECRQAVVDSLRASAFTGTGDLGPWCSQTYEWFQKKYGDLCPEQCGPGGPAQCASTCEWLQQRKAFDVRASELR